MGLKYESDVTTLPVEMEPRGVPHPAMLRGQQHFNIFRDLRVNINHVSVLDTVSNEDSGYDSLIQGQKHTNNEVRVLQAERNILKRLMMEECQRWITKLATGSESVNSTEQESQYLSAEQSTSLRLMGVSLDIPARGEHASIASFREQLNVFSDNNQWMPVSHMAFAAHVFNSNVIVWEPAEDGRVLRPYNNVTAAGSYNGLYLSDGGRRFIHVLYNRGKKENGENIVRCSEKRSPDGTLRSLNHYQTMFLSKEAATSFSAAAEQLYDAIEKGTNGSVEGNCPSTCTGGVPSGDRCTAMVQRGKRKGEICNIPSKTPGSGKCGLHSRIRCTQTQTAAFRGANNGGSRSQPGGIEINSDDEFFDRGEDLAPDGAEDSTMTERKLRRQAEDIREPAYREAYMYVHDIHPSKKTKKVEKGLDTASESTRYLKMLADWCGEGLSEEDNPKMAADRRFHEKSSRACRPTAETLKRFPTITVHDLARWELANGASYVDERKLGFEAVQLVFPRAAVELIVKETNCYHDFCQGNVPDYQPVPGGGKHTEKSTVPGHTTWPEEGIDENDIWGVIGTMMYVGLGQLPKVAEHWSTHELSDLLPARACMPRDLFDLIYGRFLRFAQAEAGAQETNPQGEEEGGAERRCEHPLPDCKNDKMHHIRRLQELLNAAWSSVVKIGAVIVVGERVVKNESLASMGTESYEPEKPTKHGIRTYAVGDPTGWCFVSYVDVGFAGDPRLAAWADCPMGRMPRLVLFVLFLACAEFAQQANGSGAFFVADNYFMSPLLLLCLAAHKVFGFGAVKRNRIGVPGAFKFWDSKEVHLENAGEARYARTTKDGKEFAVVEFRDSRDVLFVSNVHVFDKDVKGLPYRKHAGGDGQAKGLLLLQQQPTVREDYDMLMGAVDPADQGGGTFMANHKSQNFPWRRVFDHCVFLGLNNAYLLFSWWVKTCLEDTDAALQALPSSGGESPGDTVARGAASGLTRAQLRAIRVRLESLSGLARDKANWMRTVSLHLVSKCTRSAAAPTRSGAPKPHVFFGINKKWEVVLKSGRKCDAVGCSTETTGACRCDWCCTHSVGGVIICRLCFEIGERHESAGRNRVAESIRSRAKKSIPWERLAPVTSPGRDDSMVGKDGRASTDDNAHDGSRIVAEC